MYPILFHFPEWLPLLGGEPVTSFGAMMLLAFLTGAFVLRSEMRRTGIDPDHAWDILFVAVVGGFLGARAYYALLNFDLTLRDPVGMLLARGGMVWYGGLIGATVLIVWQIRRAGLPLRRMADLLAPSLAIGYAIGRVGCFLVGDDYGRPTASAVGIRFPEGAPPTTVVALEETFGIDVDPEIVDRFGAVVPVHPTQLYEAAFSTLVFLFLWRIRGGARAPGWLFSIWMVLAGTERFAVEFVRVKDDRFFGPLSLAQVISLALVAAGIWGVVRFGSGDGRAGDRAGVAEERSTGDPGPGDPGVGRAASV